MKQYLDKILTVSNNELDAIPYTEFNDVLPKLDGFNGWFRRPSGQEHYKLLMYVSQIFDNAIFLDIGTNMGASALALSKNKTNFIRSYDVQHFKEVEYILEPNIKFINNDLLKEEVFNDTIQTSSLILLDTLHDGIYEKLFYDVLVKSEFQGLLMLDDIKLNQPMYDFWDSIEFEKYDLTTKGHVTGTGLVDFSSNIKKNKRKKKS